MDLGPTQMWGGSGSAEDESALGPTQVWGKHASTPAENKVKRRLAGKQQAPKWYTEACSKEDGALMALLDEACAAETVMIARRANNMLLLALRSAEAAAAREQREREKRQVASRPAAQKGTSGNS